MSFMSVVVQYCLGMGLVFRWRSRQLSPTSVQYVVLEQTLLSVKTATSSLRIDRSCIISALPMSREVPSLARRLSTRAKDRDQQPLGLLHNVSGSEVYKMTVQAWHECD